MQKELIPIKKLEPKIYQKLKLRASHNELNQYLFQKAS